MDFTFNQAMYPHEETECGICYAAFEPSSVWVWVDLAGTAEMVCDRCLQWIGERAEREPELGWPTFAHYEEALRRYPEPVYAVQEGSCSEPGYWERFGESEIDWRHLQERGPQAFAGV